MDTGAGCGNIPGQGVMPSFLSARKPEFLYWGFCVLSALVSAYVMIYALGVSAMLRDGPHHTSMLWVIDGTLVRPYIYRTLMTAVSQFIVSITPAFIEESVNSLVLSAVHTDFGQRFAENAKWVEYSTKLATPQYLYTVIVTVALMYACIVAYSFVLLRIARVCFPKHPLAAYATALAGLVILLPLINAAFKTYDPPTLLLAALCLYFMLLERWKAYLITFIFTCINKETAILQTVVFAMAFHNRMPVRQFVKLLVMQVAIFACIKMGISLYFVDQPGHVAKYREAWVIAIVSRVIEGYHLMLLVMLCWCLFSRWQEIPHVLRHTLWIFAGLLPVYYLLGYPYEYRVFIDCYPGFTVIACYTLFRKIDSPPPKTEAG